jgi:hypothetical protein
MLGRLVELYRNPAVGERNYGLDGDIRVLKFDVNQDGIVDASAGDRVWLFFGMRRGGRHYYALDVTQRDAPRWRWSIGPAELPGIGETWSTPTIARVRVGGGATQNGENFVLIFGGGYDDAQENYQYTTDTSGHRIYMVDAASGQRLWFAGGPNGDGTPNLGTRRHDPFDPGSHRHDRHRRRPVRGSHVRRGPRRSYLAVRHLEWRGARLARYRRRARGIGLRQHRPDDDSKQSSLLLLRQTSP